MESRIHPWVCLRSFEDSIHWDNDRLIISSQGSTHTSVKNGMRQSAQRSKHQSSRKAPEPPPKPLAINLNEPLD